MNALIAAVLLSLDPFPELPPLSDLCRFPDEIEASQQITLHREYAEWLMWQEHVSGRDFSRAIAEVRWSLRNWEVLWLARQDWPFAGRASREHLDFLRTRLGAGTYRRPWPLTPLPVTTPRVPKAVEPEVGPGNNVAS